MTRYDKRTRAVTGLLFLLFIVMVAVLNILTPDQTFSESENRVLERRPPFSLRSLLAGKFTSDYETYITDQFAFRDVWIGLKTDADRVMGKKDSNGVYLGKDGYLIQHFSSPLETEVNDRVQAIQSIHQTTPDLRKYIMLVPTAAALLRDKLPAYAPMGDEHAALNLVRQSLPSGIRFVDVYPALYAGREEAIFYKTDHHWTSKGAYYAYRVLCKQMEIVPKDEAAFNIRQVTDAFYGSLYSKSGFRHLQPDRIDLYLPKEESKKKLEYVDEGRTTNSLYQMDNLAKKDKYAVFLNGNHALVRITTDHPDGKKLLVVKDSYANSLIPFFSEHFAEIDVVDLRYYEESVTKLIQDRQFHEMLFLYNVKTFFEDTSILNIME
ncbi:DHHW motif protein [Brevibacillus sp. AG162]|uniref:DHHW family protein n=1 Tax=Brevibacillus sp. AG162 TaxID=2572910 RepID=UPI00114E5596|nr:DHHW family protein [Brevibacillus sp. AG162]TQK53378.1 DHHW motif protein [Brevibacillus sp. AG162]